MRYVHTLSWIFTAVGIALVTIGVATTISPTWTLIGLLLTWAGITKIIAAHLWRGIFSPARETSDGRERRPPG